MNYSKTLLLGLVLIVTACQEVTPEPTTPTPPAPAFDEAQEQAAILEVIKTETRCFFERDYDCWKDQWLHADHAFLAWNNTDGSCSAHLDWDAVDQAIRQYIQENPATAEDRFSEAKREGMKIKFYGEAAAYLTWTQYNTNPEQTEYKTSYETRILEKTDAGWKIVNVSAFWDNPNAQPVDSMPQ